MRVVDIDLFGVVYGAEAAPPAIKRAGGGAIVVTASLAGLSPDGRRTPATAWPRAARSRSSARWRPRLDRRGHHDLRDLPRVRRHRDHRPDPRASSRRPASRCSPPRRSPTRWSLAWTSAEPGAAYVIQPGVGAIPYKFKGVPSAKTEPGRPPSSRRRCARRPCADVPRGLPTSRGTARYWGRRTARPARCAMRHEIRTEIDIEAPPDEVWAQLADLDAYAGWNPFITRAEGAARPGRRLSLRMQPAGGRAVTIRPHGHRRVPGSALEWLGHLGVPGIFDGRHRFELTATPDGDPPRAARDVRRRARPAAPAVAGHRHPRRLRGHERGAAPAGPGGTTDIPDRRGPRGVFGRSASFLDFRNGRVPQPSPDPDGRPRPVRGPPRRDPARAPLRPDLRHRVRRGRERAGPSARRGPPRDGAARVLASPRSASRGRGSTSRGSPRPTTPTTGSSGWPRWCRCWAC